MRAFVFVVFFALMTVAYGVWPFCSVAVPVDSVDSVDSVVAVLGTRPELPGYKCYPLYSDLLVRRNLYDRYKFLPAASATPYRLPRPGLSFEDLQYAHLIITYSECSCFDPTTQKGWDYLTKCNRLFDDLDELVNKFTETKKEMVAWDEKASALKADL